MTSDNLVPNSTSPPSKSFIVKIGEMLELYAFLAPAYVIFLLFTFVPVLRSFYLSFFDYSLLSFQAPEYVGLQNFTDLFHDSVLKESVINTVVYALTTVPARLVLGLLIAILLT